MKNRVFRSVALVLALVLLGGMALAEVRTTASVWMRTGPGLNYDQVVSFSEGKSLEYLGESSVDDRGVTWYKVSGGGNTGWVSSRYSELVGESANAPKAEKPAAESTPEPTAEPAEEQPASLPALEAGLLFSSIVSGDAEASDAQPSEDSATEPADAQPAAVVELSAYYLRNLVEAANEIGLISYRQVESEVPFQYYDNSLILAGNQQVENMVVYGGGYTVYGVSVGMDANAARACLNAAGLDYMDSVNGFTYEHRAAEGAAYVDANGHDSCINLWVDADNIVTEIDWSTYTG